MYIQKKYKYQHKTTDDSLKRKSKPKKHNRQQFNKTKQNSLFFTALSKHAPGAGSPQKKKQGQRTKQAMTQTRSLTYTHTYTQMTIRFHLFDKTKQKSVTSKRKQSRHCQSQKERERENNACSKFRTIDPFGPFQTTILSNLTRLPRKRRCLNLILLQTNTKWTNPSNPLLSVSNTQPLTQTNIHNTHTKRNCKTRIE